MVTWIGTGRPSASEPARSEAWLKRESLADVASGPHGGPHGWSGLLANCRAVVSGIEMFPVDPSPFEDHRRLDGPCCERRLCSQLERGRDALEERLQAWMSALLESTHPSVVAPLADVSDTQTGVGAAPRFSRTSSTLGADSSPEIRSTRGLEAATLATRAPSCSLGPAEYTHPHRFFLAQVFCAPRRDQVSRFRALDSGVSRSDLPAGPRPPNAPPKANRAHHFEGVLFQAIENTVRPAGFEPATFGFGEALAAVQHLGKTTGLSGRPCIHAASTDTNCRAGRRPRCPRKQLVLNGF